MLLLWRWPQFYVSSLLRAGIVEYTEQLNKILIKRNVTDVGHTEFLF